MQKNWSLHGGIDWQVPILSSEVPAFSLWDFNGRPYWMSGLVLWFHIMSDLLLVSLLYRITDHLTLTAKACVYVCQNKCSCFQFSLMNKQGTEWRKWDLVHPYSAMRTHRNYRDVRKYKTSIKSSSLSRQWRDQFYASMQRNKFFLYWNVMLLVPCSGLEGDKKFY